MAEGDGLLNRSTGESWCESSNLSPSAKRRSSDWAFFGAIMCCLFSYGIISLWRIRL